MLFKAGLYKPPNIWSVVEVAKEVREYIDAKESDAVVFVGLSDEGISKDRLTRGCDECDTMVKEAISKFNGSQKIKDLDVSCSHCKEAWQREQDEERVKHPNVWRYIQDNTPLDPIIESDLGKIFRRERVPLEKFSDKDLRLLKSRRNDFPEGLRPTVNNDEGYIEFPVFSIDDMESVLTHHYEGEEKDKVKEMLSSGSK